MQSVNETLDMDMSPQPTKRRRSSILKAVDRRTTNRDSRTVSFNITKFLANEDMEITMMEVPRNETLTSSIDMSMDLTLVPEEQDVTITNKTRNTTANISTDTTTIENSNKTKNSTMNMATDSTTNNSIINSSTTTTNTTLDATTNMETSMNTTTNSYSMNNTSIKNTTMNNTSIKNTTMNNTSINMVAKINASLPHGCTLDESDLIDDDTLFGAFHDSNNMSFVSTRTSGFDTLMLNIDALNDRYQKVEHDLEECRRRLDSEIDELFKFYRHVVNKDDRYEFAVAILGLRHSLWLWFKINPDTYPNEKLNVRIVSHKKDRNLYPLKDYAKTVSRFTKEGHHGYLTKFVINAQRFRRLLRKVGYGRSN